MEILTGTNCNNFPFGFPVLLLPENGRCLIDKLAGAGFTNVTSKTVNAYLAKICVA